MYYSKNKKLRIKQHDILDVILISAMLLQICLLNYFGIAQFFTKFIALLIIIRLFIYKGRTKGMKGYLHIPVMGIVSLCMAVASMVFGINNTMPVFKSNFLAVTYTLIYSYYFVFLVRRKEDWLKEYFINSFWILNWYFAINCVMLLYQAYIYGFLTGSAVVLNLQFADLISGLFGAYGTHYLAFFSVFIILYNYYIYNGKFERPLKQAGGFFLGIYFVFNLIISILNDNKFYYILLALFIFMLYMCAYITRKPNKVSLKQVEFWSVVLAGSIVFAFIINSDSESLKSVRDAYNMLVDNITVIYKNKTIVAGSSERFYLIYYAFRYYRGISTGYGLGAYGFDDMTAFSFYHFGLSDLGTFLCLGGIVFTLPLFVYYVLSYLAIFRKEQRTIMCDIGVNFLTLIIAIYTTSFRMPTLQVDVILCLLMLRFAVSVIKIDSCI